MTHIDYGVILETRGRNHDLLSLTKDEDCGDNVLFMEDSENEICSMKAVKQVHEINRHKKKEQLVAAYRNAGWLSPQLVKTI